MEKVHVWVGKFDSKQRFDAFMTEKPQHGGAALNEFARTQKTRRYDHDWVEGIWCEGQSLRQVIGKGSYSTNYVEPALAAAKVLRVSTANALVVIDANEIRSPQSAQADGYELRYIGTFTGHVPEPRKSADSETELDLRGLGSTKIPPEVFERTTLKVLRLDGLGLKRLPSAIGNLQALESLSLTNNNLKTLPSTLGQLQQLTELFLSNNAFSKVPTPVGKLKQLESLVLSQNPLTELAPALFRATALKYLEASDLPLRELPAGIGKLVNLEALWLQRIELTALPPEIGALKKLVDLRVFGDQLADIPLEIGHLTALESLRVGNAIRDLPATLMKLQGLKRLSIRMPPKARIRNKDLAAFVKDRTPRVGRR